VELAAAKEEEPLRGAGPKGAVSGLMDRLDISRLQGGAHRLEALSIVAIEPALRTHPQETVTILQQAVRGHVVEPAQVGKAAETIALRREGRRMVNHPDREQYPREAPRRKGAPGSRAEACRRWGIACLQAHAVAIG
jgi:hypothetical protein